MKSWIKGKKYQLKINIFNKQGNIGERKTN